MSQVEPGPGACAPDSCAAALLIIDVINTLDFDSAESLVQRARPMTEALVGLKARCKEHGIPTIYVNDNFGRWRSDFSALVEHCRQPKYPGHEMVEKLAPEECDYFVFKPMHSAFYQTTLELLLAHLQARHLIITGMASNICVLCTANDAHMRGYQLWLPPDTMAAASGEEQDYALLHFEKALSAKLTPSGDLPLARMASEEPFADPRAKRDAETDSGQGQH